MKRIFGILLVLMGAASLITGCSKGKEPQAKEEPASVKVASVPKKKDITEQSTKKESSEKEEVIDLGKGVKLEMVLIPAGKFIIVSRVSEKSRQKDNQHEVTLTKPFYMGKYEVTQEQYETVGGYNRSGRPKGAKFPVTSVSWEDCQEFITKLNAKTNGSYRLPTDAEWEYACRAGTTTEYSFGDKITPKDGNYDGSKIGKPVEVGSYKPNAFGLHDMHGNVWEWCNDWHTNYPAGAGSLTDPKGPATGKDRVLRGGSFSDHESNARSSYRSTHRSPKTRYNSDGFRLAITK